MNGRKSMKIFITGGTGLIGSSFIDQRLQSHPHDEITVLTRSVQTAKNKISNKAQFVEDLSSIRMADYDCVLNLAGEPIADKRWSQSQKRIISDSRWQLTEQLSNKINKECANKDIRFISGSAVGYYGRQNQHIITEMHGTCFPEFSHTLCQKWEDIASHTKNAHTAIIRTGIVLSHQGGALEKLLLPFKFGLGGKIGSGEQYMPWIHIDDMISAINYLIEHPSLVGPFNLTAPNPVTNKTFSQTLAKVLNRPCFCSVPAFVMELLMGEMSDLVLYGQNAVPHNLEKAGFEFEFKSLKAALENIVIQA